MQRGQRRAAPASGARRPWRAVRACATCPRTVPRVLVVLAAVGCGGGACGSVRGPDGRSWSCRAPYRSRRHLRNLLVTWPIGHRRRTVAGQSGHDWRSNRIGSRKPDGPARSIARITADGDLDLGPTRPRRDVRVGQAEAKRRLSTSATRWPNCRSACSPRHPAPLLVVLQAMDAGGKDGVIRDGADRHQPGRRQRHLVRRAERGGARPRLPAGGSTRHTPAKGQIGVFNRSATTRTCSSCA